MTKYGIGKAVLLIIISLNAGEITHQHEIKVLVEMGESCWASKKQSLLMKAVALENSKAWYQMRAYVISDNFFLKIESRWSHPDPRCMKWTFDYL